MRREVRYASGPDPEGAMAATKKKGVKRRRNVTKATTPLDPRGMRGDPTAEVASLAASVEADGGALLGAYREPYAGRWLLLVALPIEKVERTPYQRDLSDAHVRRLGIVISKVGRFLDPIVATRNEDGTYWTPNGGHRLQALTELGAKSITALLVPEPDVATKILALNTEKAHNLREKALEVIRMARSLSGADGIAKEKDFAFEFEEAAFLTLGACYELKGRFGGGAYHPMLKRIDEFLDRPLAKSLEVRADRARRMLALDERVGEIVAQLRERGLVSAYLRPFVVARINPLAFSKAKTADFDDTLEKATANAKKFDPSKIRPEHLARMGGAPPAAEEG
jgi:ParB family chromosome partitioning protein